EATAIAAYFNAASVRESNVLKKHLAIIGAYKKAAKELASKEVATPRSPTTVPSADAKPWVDAMIAHAGAQIAGQHWKEAAATLQQADALASAAKLVEQVGPTTKPVSARLKDAITTLNDNRVPDSIPWPGDDWWQR